MDACIAGRWIGIEGSMHIAVGRPFGAHGIKMIGCLEHPPDLQMFPFMPAADAGLQIVQALNRVLLHITSDPGGQAPLPAAQDRTAVSHLFNNMRSVMVIDEFRAAKGGRRPAKKGFYFPFMPQDLLYEFSMFPEKGV